MSKLQEAAQQIALLRRFSGKTGDPFGKEPIPRVPSMQEAKYVRYVRTVSRAIKIQTEKLLKEYLPRIKTSYDIETKRDDWSDDLESLRISLENGYDNVLTAAQLEQSVKEISEEIDGFNLREFQRMSVKVFGVPVANTELWRGSLVKSWVNENVSLIKNITRQTAEEVHGIVQRGVKEGARVTHIRNRVLSSLKLNMENSGQDATTASAMRKLRNRATLIAVDQTGKLNGQLTENRQKDIGGTGYTWRNVGDERVRGNPVGLYRHSKYDHWNRDGKKFKWSEPPEDGHPGWPVRCRCSAEADLENLINEILSIEEKR